MNKNIKTKILFSAIGISTLFLSCKKEETPPNDKKQEILTQQVELLANDSNVIDYRLARYLAYEELIGGAKNFINLDENDFTLSETPKVIYDAENQPKYYEFDLTVAGEKKATITTIAQKIDNTVIAYMFEGDGSAQEVENQGFGELQPKSLTAQSAINYEENVSSEWEAYEQLFPQMSDEEREAMQKSIAELKADNELLQAEELNAEAVKIYWQEQENLLNFLKQNPSLEMREVQIAQEKLLSPKAIKPNDGDLYSGLPSSYSYIIPEYNKNNLKRTSWDAECGPAVICWFYRGKYAYYPKNSKNYIPIHGDKYVNNFKKDPYYVNRPYLQNYTSYHDCKKGNVVADHGLYNQCKKHVYSLGEMYELGLKNAVKEVTQGEYKVTSTAFSHDHIKKNEVCFVMVVQDGVAHYFVAFGYGYTKKGLKKTEYIFVTDNGALTGNNTVNKYYPYWRKEYSNYGLRYKVTK